MVGAKSQAAAGFRVSARRTERAWARSAPQHMKPMPTGRMPDGVLGIGEARRLYTADWSSGASVSNECLSLIHEYQSHVIE